MDYRKIEKLKYVAFLLFITFTIQSSCAQQDDVVRMVFTAFDNSNYNDAAAIIKNLEQSPLKTELDVHYQLLKHGKWTENLTRTPNTLSRAYNIRLLNSGIVSYIKEGNDFKAFDILTKSLSLAKQRNDKVLICQHLKFMLEIYLRYHVVIKDPTYKYIIEDFRKFAISKIQHEIIDYFEFHIFIRFNYKEQPEQAIALYKRYADKDVSNTFYKARKFLALNTYFRKKELGNNNDSAFLYKNKAKKLIHNVQKGLFEREREKAILINEANTFIELDKFEKGLAILDTIATEKNEARKNFDNYPEYLLTKYINYSKSNTYYGLNDSLNGLKYENDALVQEQNDALFISQSQVAELGEKYKTAEQKKELAEKEIENNRNENMIIGLIALLLFVSIVAFLTRTALKRKQQLAEKEKELEVQKREELLRKHEIQTVNAMIVGQEKERKRIANDLHDNINSEIVTAKIQLEHLSENITKIENPKKILDLCVDILDEAYHKTRNISHERNSGVLAQKELIPGIRKLAEKASTAFGLMIHVHDYGFESKLSNGVEITIFSIVQELVTNILKHSEANEASVSLTQHEEELTIIIEDNGIGFNTNQKLSSKGMGLSNMEQQLKQINGTLNIDSHIGKGTSVIIEIKTAIDS